MGLALLLASCQPAPSAKVDPANYDAFFLWAGVKPQPVLDRAKTVYLLAGEVRPGTGLVLLRGVPHVRKAEVWLVVRTGRLDWSEATNAEVLSELSRWRAAGNRLAGLQIDFDAATSGITGYAQFLAGLRARLPAHYQLSITGLLDWSANADPSALGTLKGVVDEVVVQTYQGRSTIPGYAAYLERLARVPVPHKVALVEGGEWREPPGLRRDPLFRGYVVFLLNPASPR